MVWEQASTDQSVLDLEMANKLGWCAFSIIQLLGTIGVMSQVAWEVFVIFIPVTAICIWYQVMIPSSFKIQTVQFLVKILIITKFAAILHTDCKGTGSTSGDSESSDSSSFRGITLRSSNYPSFRPSRTVHECQPMSH